eukprot:6182709-Pleurochrysis_carterae.AAC.3
MQSGAEEVFRVLNVDMRHTKTFVPRRAMRRTSRRMVVSVLRPLPPRLAPWLLSLCCDSRLFSLVRASSLWKGTPSRGSKRRIAQQSAQEATTSEYEQLYCITDL